VASDVNGVSSLSVENQNVTVSNVYAGNLDTSIVGICAQLSNIEVDTLTGPLIGPQELHILQDSQYNNVKVKASDIIITSVTEAGSITGLNAMTGSISFTGVFNLNSSNIIAYKDIAVVNCYNCQFSNITAGLTGSAGTLTVVDTTGSMTGPILQFTNIFVDTDISIQNINGVGENVAIFTNLTQVNSGNVNIVDSKININGFLLNPLTPMVVDNVGVTSETIVTLLNGVINNSLELGSSVVSPGGNVDCYVSNCVINGDLTCLTATGFIGLVGNNMSITGAVSYNGGSRGLIVNSSMDNLTIGTAGATGCQLDVVNSHVNTFILLGEFTQGCRLSNIGCLTEGDVTISGDYHIITNLSKSFVDAPSDSWHRLSLTGASNCVVKDITYKGTFYNDGNNNSFSNILIGGVNRDLVPPYSVQSFEVYGNNHRLKGIQLGNVDNLKNMTITLLATDPGYLTGGFGSPVTGNYSVVIGSTGALGSENIQVTNLTIYPITGQVGVNVAGVGLGPIIQTVNNIEFNVRNSQVSNVHVYYSPTGNNGIAGHTGITGTTVFITPLSFSSKFSNMNIGYGNQNPLTMTGPAGSLAVQGEKTSLGNICVSNILTATGPSGKFNNVTTNILHNGGSTGTIYTGCQVLSAAASTVPATSFPIMVGNQGVVAIGGYPGFLPNPGMIGTNT
jgi:hypothetical protein